MPTRRGASIIENLYDIAALLPRWAGVMLAVAAYAVMNCLAAHAPPPVTSPDQMARAVAVQSGKVLAGVGQYLVPAALLIGAAASVLRRRKRAGLLQGVAGAESRHALLTIGWRDFELLVGEAFRRRGFSVAEADGGADGGVDLELRKGGETFLVQCKQWRARRVPVRVVRELYGVMAARAAAGGFVVTSGAFTAEAQAFAKGRNIALLDGAALTMMVGEAQAVRGGALPTDAEASRSEPLASNTPAEVPPCPPCGSAMVTRTARRGPHAGRAFWGCKSFPTCRGVRDAGR